MDRRQFLGMAGTVLAVPLLPEVPPEEPIAPRTLPPGGASDHWQDAARYFGANDSLSVKLWSRQIAKEVMLQTKLMELVAITSA